MTLLFIVFLFAMLALSFPIFLALIIPSTFFLLFAENLPLMIPVQRVISGLNSYTLLAIPFFVFAATIMGKGMIGKKLIELSRNLVGHMYGGVALTGITATTIVGAISGAGTAGILTVGPMIVDEMEKFKYGRGFAAALITSISSVAMLIPPSIIFIIYAMNTGTSVARLFLGGLGAGLTFSAIYALFSYIIARKQKLPLLSFQGIKKTFLSIIDSLWALGLPVVVLGGMYSGIFSPTEAAGVSAVYAIFVEMVIYKNVKVKDLFEIAKDTGATVSMIYLLLGGGTILAYSFTLANIPDLLQSLIGDNSYISVLLIINITFLIAGMFVGPGEAIIILIPLFLPLANAVGIDPLHLGVMVVTNLAIGMFSPPFGLNLFVSTGVLKVPLGNLIKSLVPFYALSFFILIIIMFIPSISLWLPNLIMGQN